MQAGALDVSLIPIQMKKGRPGFLLRLLTDPAHADSLKECILRETTAIGLRFQTMQRMTLPRAIIELETSWGRVRAKKAETADGWRITPEYEDCARLADQHNIPLQKIYAAAAEAGSSVSHEFSSEDSDG